MGSARHNLLQRYAGWRLNRLRPGLGDRFLEADRICTQDRAALQRWRMNPGDRAVLDLGPTSEPGVSRHDIDPFRLLSAARTAYETMAWALTGSYERAYPKFTTVSAKSSSPPTVSTTRTPEPSGPARPPGRRAGA